MYKKILAPLDTSEIAECALSHVKAIAGSCQVPEVILLSVIEPMLQINQLRAELGEDWVRNAIKGQRAFTEDYLKKKAAVLKKDGISVSIVIAEGVAADEILDYSRKNNVDLIIMSSHGRSGPARWALGSVADRVVRHATVPVLTAAAPACRIG
jgi:nucleotide-binding universal stress UspA family protein